MSEKSTTTIEELFEEHGGAMTARARRILGSEADAEDAVQEAMLSALASPHVFAGVERIGAWIFTVVRRRCVDLIRSDSRRKSKEAEVGLEDLFEHDDPEELMERSEFAEAVADAVAGLSDDLKDVFVKNALERKTFKVISEETGIPMGTLMARKKRAVDLMRSQLQKQGFAV